MHGLGMDFVGFTAVFMSLALPIVVIVAIALTAINKKKHDKEIRQLIIENNVEPESIKLLIEEPAKKSSKYKTLRWGSLLAGMGLGALINFLAQVSDEDTYFWLIIAFGVGVGLLVSFIIETILARKEAKNEG